MSVLIRPRRNDVFTLAVILKKLELSDSPCLMFRHEGKMVTIQDSHVTEAQLTEAMGETKWTYIYETDEWIPVFEAVDDEQIHKLVDIEREIDPFEKDPNKLGWYVTPKAYPSAQYYANPDNIPDWYRAQLAAESIHDAAVKLTERNHEDISKEDSSKPDYFSDAE